MRKPFHNSVRLSVALTLVVPLVSWDLTGCAPTTPRPVLRAPDGSKLPPPAAPAASDEQAAQSLLDQAKALQDRGDAAGANKKRDQIVATYPGTAVAADIFASRGQQAEAAGNAAAAIEFYEKLLFYRPSYPGGDIVRESYAKLLTATGRFDDAANMLRPLYKNRRAGPDRGTIGLLLIQALMSANRPDEALSICVDVFAASEVPAQTKENLRQLSLDILDGRLPFKSIAELWEQVKNKPDWAFLQPAIAYKLAKIYYHTRNYERSEEMLQLVTRRFAGSPYSPAAQDFLAQRLKARFIVDPNAVGVLLPLTGKYQEYGTRSLEAIRLALGAFPSIKLIVKDTQGDATVTSQAVEQLVLSDHVIAIIGPLFSTEAQTAALKAEELSVPILTLSFKEGLPQVGPYVFRTALTVQAQAQALAKAAFESLGFTRFALLYPRTRYGIEFVGAFWDEVERRKGEIRGAESYEHDETTFAEPVRKLVARWYTIARQDYKQALNEIRAKHLPPHRLRMETDKLDKGLPPIVDFDAVVIPDESRNIGLVAPALVFEDIVLTHDPKMLDKIKKASGRTDIKPITLLGASTWNKAETIEKCEQYCENAVFVDAFYPDSPDPKVRDFAAAFKAATNADPQLTDAQAFDTAGLLRTVLTSGLMNNRAKLKDALRNMKPYDGVTGRLRFDKDGDASRDLMILTIGDQLIRPWQPPEADVPRG